MMQVQDSTGPCRRQTLHDNGRYQLRFIRGLFMRATRVGVYGI
jgi:hypothetical protein